MKKKEIEAPLNISNADALHTPQASNSMVDIVVRMKQDDTFANLKVSSFDLILSLEFLLKIAQFVTVPDDGRTAITAPTSAASTAVAKCKFTQKKFIILRKENARDFMGTFSVYSKRIGCSG